MADYPQVYSTAFAIGNATTSGDFVAFGFDARWLYLANYEAVDMYLDFTGGRGSTTGAYLRACSDRWWPNAPPIAGLGAKTTSTGATDKLLRILAMR